MPDDFETQIQSDEFAHEYEDYLAYCFEMEGSPNEQEHS